ncbi:MAG: GerMN domain-containing protein, partial [Clostridiaceae bacterium]|nr:GerMN domain-containing protein [Clostridiaceae bacterium]
MKKLLFLILGTLLLLVLLTGCNDMFEKPGKIDGPVVETPSKAPGNSGEVFDNEKNVRMKLYFPTIDNSRILSEEREVKVKDDAILMAALKALIAGPERTELRNAMPDGTAVLSVKKENNTAVIDFSEEYGKVNGLDEVVERISIVNTLTEITGVEKVRILVAGKDLIGPSGEAFGELTRVLLDSQGYPKTSGEKPLTLYFSDQQAEYLVPEVRNVQLKDGETTDKVISAIIEELKKGPVTDELGAVIPEGTRLLSAKVKDGICTLDFSKDFVDNNMGSAGEMMTLYSIVNSMTELPEVNKVQFLIEGKTREVYLHSSLD